MLETNRTVVSEALALLHPAALKGTLESMSQIIVAHHPGKTRSGSQIRRHARAVGATAQGRQEPAHVMTSITLVTTASSRDRAAVVLDEREVGERLLRRDP